MNKEELVKEIQDSQYPFKLSEKQESICKESNLVAVYKVSDIMIFRGAICDKKAFYKDAEVIINPRKRIIIKPWHEVYDIMGDEESARDYLKVLDGSRKIKVLLDKSNDPVYTWIFETEIPHVTFNIYDGDEKYCRGIVFSIDDLESIPKENQSK